MKQIKSLSEKRLIIPATINMKPARMLIDTGASVGILSDASERRLKLLRGRPFNAPVYGAGGQIDACICNSFAYVGGHPLSQFLIADIDAVVESIEKETSITIDGIIALPQMKMIGMKINAFENEIIVD